MKTLIATVETRDPEFVQKVVLNGCAAFGVTTQREETSEYDFNLNIFCETGDESFAKEYAKRVLEFYEFPYKKFH